MTTPTEPKKKKSRTLPKILSRDDVQKILDIPNTDARTGLRNRAILQVLYRAGLRVSEVCNLTISDLDIEKGFIYVQLGKGGRDRYVPLDKETMDLLLVWLDQRPQGSEWLFPTLKSTALDTRYVREVVYRASQKAGVFLQNGKQKAKVHPHNLRHTCFTELIEEGFHIAEVQALAGHSSIQTTAVYLSVRPAALAEKIRNRQVVQS